MGAVCGGYMLHGGELCRLYVPWGRIVLVICSMGAKCEGSMFDGGEL